MTGRSPYRSWLCEGSAPRGGMYLPAGARCRVSPSVSSLPPGPPSRCLSKAAVLGPTHLTLGRWSRGRSPPQKHFMSRPLAGLARMPPREPCCLWVGSFFLIKQVDLSRGYESVWKCGAGGAHGDLQKRPRASEYAETFMINQTTQLPTEGREWAGTHSEAALYFGNK